MISNWIDNAISVFSPAWAARRVHARSQLNELRAAYRESYFDQLISSNNRQGYEGGKVNRLTREMASTPWSENDISRGDLQNLRARSWQLHRNNSQARKIVRQLKAKVIGNGLTPQPQAKHDDGAPFTEFRQRAKDVWQVVCKELDYRGRQGVGKSFVGIQKTALHQVVLSGSVFFRIRRLTVAEQRRRGLLLPLTVQLIHRDRLDESRHGDDVFHGIQLDDEQIPVGWWLNDADATMANSLQTGARLWRSPEVRHLFWEEDVDQLDGVPWFCATILKMRDRDDYEFNEITSSKMASCVVAGYRRSTGQTGFGLPNPDGGQQLTDSSGNEIEYLQPGMLVNLGTDGDLQLLNPQRPGANISEFISHLLRSEASGVAGIKGSTVTQDYRGSSFSSERSADNDVWPEIFDVQHWLAEDFVTPIYEEVITTAVSLGLFDDVAGFNITDFVNRQRSYLLTQWGGPVPKSINQRDDASAARQRVAGGSSSPQREAATVGATSEELLDEISEFIESARAKGIPEAIIMQQLGIDLKDTAEENVDLNSPEGREQLLDLLRVSAN